MELNNKTILLDQEGFLKDISDWQPEVAEQLARNEEITLTDAHWEIIWLLRKFYERFQMSPAMRPLVKFVAHELGESKGRSVYLMQLFPGSPAKLASKIAGLPKPDNCF
jgi:tRNA 2-thiouridine synthesizing protein E